jgi:very-short-patch-repair endonuclease/DNA polymerase III delta prime subunit
MAQSESGRSTAGQKNSLVSSYEPDRLWPALYNLRQKARASIEERGVNILHIALGFLLWTDTQERGEKWRAPLILVPVTIERLGPEKYRVCASEEDIVLNPTLSYKLAHDFGLRLPDLPDEWESLRFEDYLSSICNVVTSLPNVTMERSAYLGLFSFLKIAMYQDLARNSTALLEHPIVARLAGLPVPIPDPIIDTIPQDLDNCIDPRLTFQILDADSSQQEALLVARQGSHLLLQGPPGTGKSQTIANLIAESFAAGKRILFVSEKAAALEVVKRRLDECGLGDACLELHGYQADKRKVLDELKRILDAPQSCSSVRASTRLEALFKMRDELNAYARALHAPRFRLQYTAFEVHGLLARIRHTPSLRYRPERVTELSENDLHLHRTRLETLALHAHVIDRLTTHPWRGLKARPMSFAFKGELRDHLSALRRTVEELERHLADARTGTGFDWPVSIRRLEEIFTFFGKYRIEIMALPAEEWCQRFEKSYATWSRVLKLRYWKDVGHLRSFCRSDWTWRHSVVAADLERLRGIQALLVLKSGSLPDDAQFCSHISTLSSLVREMRAELGYFREQFELDTFPYTMFEDDPRLAVQWCDEHVHAFGLIDEYLTYVHDRDLAVADGLGPFINVALTDDLPVRDWVNAYFRAFYEAWLDEAGCNAPELAYFSRATHEKRIEQFRNLDREQLNLAQQSIAERIASARPRPTEFTQRAPSAEITVLVREFQKKRRIKPLRRLFRETSHVAQALKPCFMMSPLSVSQFLDPDHFRFDLVIFDEASQVKVEDAVGCIFRGQQLVVAGDSKQLPPTRFFDVMTSDEDWDEEGEEEASEVYESIMDALTAYLPGRMLRWHYRSHHEALIAFSNKNFYDNQLYTFPHPEQAGNLQPVQFIYVPDGIYERGGARCNMIETRRVVELVLQHVQQHPKWSLAVITFSDAQRDAIQRELDRQLTRLPELRWFFEDKHPEPFRVKNLELIQGDERDVIIFSVGYGRDETGKPPALNFGPLNKDGGNRRLNVAVTRARQRVVVVSSMQPEELMRSDNPGVRALREYMLLARDGLSALIRASTTVAGEVESPFEASVYAALTAAGLEVHPQVGVSGYRIDLGVVDPRVPGRYCLGIECDGATYHSARTARDRDRLRQQILERNLGWHIHRIWSPEWNTNPDREVKLVLELVQQYAGYRSFENRGEPVHIADVGVVTPPPNTASTPVIAPAVDTAASPEQILPEGVMYYEFYTGSFRSRFDSPPRLVADDISEIVNIEGPIYNDALVHRVAIGWGMRKAGARIKGHIWAGLCEAKRRKLVQLSSDGNFIWPSAPWRGIVRVPRPNEEPRSMDEVCPEEIEAAIGVCLRQTGGSVSQTDLIRLVVRLFGHQRATERITAPIDAVLNQMLLSGKLESKDNTIRIPAK